MLFHINDYFVYSPHCSDNDVMVSHVHLHRHIQVHDCPDHHDHIENVNDKFSQQRRQ